MGNCWCRARRGLGNNSETFHENIFRVRSGSNPTSKIYDILEEIGHGGMCKIYKIRKKHESIGGSAKMITKPALYRLSSKETYGRRLPISEFSDREVLFALKVINLSMVQKDKVDQLKNEVMLLKTLDHKNIVKAYETFQHSDVSSLEIVMELCTGGDLRARLPYTESEAANVTEQILGAVSYMHARNVVHRDLKLENVVFESENPRACIKVIDFGLSKQYDENFKLTERVGTLYSMSPETMQGEYTAKADIWSIGVMTYMILANGQQPFEGKNVKELVARVLKRDVRFEGDIWEYKVSDDAQEFILTLLQINPEDRVSAHEALHKKWVTSSSRVLREQATPDLLEKVTDNIVRYADAGEFRKLALNVIAKKSTSDEISELRKVFDEFDTLNTGTITLLEFKEALVRFNFQDQEIERIFNKLDVNKNNVISYTEFLASALESQGTIAEYRLAEAFDLMDVDASGFISRNNLRHILGKHTSESLIDQLINEADIKGDGRISYEEFCEACKKGNAIEPHGLVD